MGYQSVINLDGAVVAFLGDTALETSLERHVGLFNADVLVAAPAKRNFIARVLRHYIALVRTTPSDDDTAFFGEV